MGDQRDHRGAYMLTRHLVSLGHKRIAYLSFPRSRRDEERLGASANAWPRMAWN